MKKKDVKRTRRSAASLLPMMQGAQKSAPIISPYFVPGDAATTAPRPRPLVLARRCGILTNSLVANDVAAVHGGYSRYRKPLSRAACNSGS